MNKIIISLLLLLCLTHNIQAQGGGAGHGVASIIVALSQRSTVLYGDTVFEIDQLQFRVTETYAFRNEIKTTIYLTNLSDHFKIIYSEDFTITDAENNPIPVRTKKPVVVAPKTVKRIGLLAESPSSFKLYDIKIGLKQIYTTGSPLTILKPNAFNIRLEGLENSKTGALEITTKKCAATPNGMVRAHFKLSYTGTNFLAIYGSKAKLLTPDRKAYPNIAAKSQILYYPENTEAKTLFLEFDNRTPNFNGPVYDQIVFENVFIEYEKKSDQRPIDFHVYKNGMEKGESPKEKNDPKNTEQKNTEITED
ncbi:MAG: hypothetical protein V4677_03300 [Bacteroidota bacterium]